MSVIAIVAVLLTVSFIPRAAADISADAVAKAKQTLERGLGFFKTLRVRGGWPMAYSEDLTRRWGEHAECGENSITVQPPATPTVGSVYLRASHLQCGKEYAAIAC